MEAQHSSTRITEVSPEFCLALAIAWLPSGAFAEHQTLLIKKLCGEVRSWDAVLVLVDRHRIPALAYTNLLGSAGIVPERIMAALKMRSQKARHQALAHTAEISRVHKILTQQGIACLPLKGSILSIQLYGDPGVRQANDMDILIQAKEFERAEKLLLAEGYQRQSPPFALPPDSGKLMNSVIHHFEYHHPQRKIMLELHWRGNFYRSQSNKYFWEYNTKTNIAGQEYTVLNEDLQLLYLCTHGAYHKYFRIKWLGDIAKIISENRISSWERVIEIATELQVLRSLALSVLLINQLFLLPIPDALSKLAKQETVQDLVPEVIEAILGKEEEVSGGIKNIVFQKRLNPSVSIATILKTMLVCRDDLKLVHFSGQLFWLYIPLRPAFWIWRHYLATENSKKK